MDKSIFNPSSQENNISSKIIVGLERISEVFKILLWEKAKLVGLSPVQIQILIFITYHKQELCNVSHLAKEFNITKPTISDAVRVLDKKASLLKTSLQQTIAVTQSNPQIWVKKLLPKPKILPIH